MLPWKLFRGVGVYLLSLHIFVVVGSPCCIAPHILNIGYRWRQVVSFKPRPLYTWGKSVRFSLDTRLMYTDITFLQGPCFLPHS
jgi:hypothetical protein